MMKTTLLLMSLGILSACGKMESRNEFGTRSFQAVSMGSDEIAALTGLCIQLSHKAGLIDSNLGSTFNFSLTEKGCGSDEGITSNVAVTAQKEGMDYVFKQNLQYFKFQYVETNNSGALKDICNNLGTLTSPYKSSNGTAVWINLNPNSSDCQLVSGTRCLLLETGTPTAAANVYEIDTRDWMRVVTDPTNSQVGFYNYRKRQSKAFCSDEKFNETSAELR